MKTSAFEENSTKISQKNNLNLFSKGENPTFKLDKYSFVTKSLILSAIFFVFTILFIIIAGIIGIMISYFLQTYNLIDKVTTLILWQKVLFFGSVLFLVANFCIFEAESIMHNLIHKNTKPPKTENNDLKSLLKIRPNSWQKIFYAIGLILVSLLTGYLAIINYISWNYSQFWI